MSKPRTERARVHGLYAKVISKEEESELAKIQPTNIMAEIDYLRTLCSRLAKNLDKNELDAEAAKPLSEAAIRTLHALDMKLNTLLRYVKTQAYLDGQPNEYDRQIEEGEFLARKRRNVFNYLSAGKKAPASDGPGGVVDV